MTSLPDFEGLAIFAKVVELRSFAAAASDLAVSKATVSKAVSRLEERLGARLFNRTSRRLALTDAGQKLSERAARLLADGEAAENEALAQSMAPRGLVRLAVPMTFGVKEVAPILPAFLEAYPDVAIDLHLDDAMVDLIGEGFDAGLRIGRLPDSSLRARRLCAMPRHTVAAPKYLRRHGRPTHPMHLAQHRCFGYAYLSTAGGAWHYTNAAGEQASVRPAGALRVNNGEAVMPALLAGLGIADLPDFIVGAAIASGEVEVILDGWKQTESAVHLLMPPGGPRPARVEALADFLTNISPTPGSEIRRLDDGRQFHVLLFGSNLPDSRSFSQLEVNESERRGLAHAKLPNFPGLRTVARLQRRVSEPGFFARTSGHDGTAACLHTGRFPALRRSDTRRRPDRRLPAAEYAATQRTMSRGF